MTTTKKSKISWVRMANKAEDCLLFLRINKLITDRIVAHIRRRIDQEARKI